MYFVKAIAGPLGFFFLFQLQSFFQNKICPLKNTQLLFIKRLEVVMYDKNYNR